MGPSGDHEVDLHICNAYGEHTFGTLPLSTMDAFTLDAFADLIHMHHAQGSTFVLARVTTLDSQTNKECYSWYHAGYLNKLLFCTQKLGERRAIHRLCVLNPLTNTEIHAVHYFAVPPPPGQKRPIDPGESPESQAGWHMHWQNTLSPASSPTPARDNGDPIRALLSSGSPTPAQGLGHELARSVINSPTSTIRSPFASLHDAFEQELFKPGKQERPGLGTSPLRELPRLSSLPSAPLTAAPLPIRAWVENSREDLREEVRGQEEPRLRAYLFATDKDYLRSASVRRFFRKNTLDANIVCLFEMPSIFDEEYLNGEMEAPSLWTHFHTLGHFISWIWRWRPWFYLTRILVPPPLEATTTQARQGPPSHDDEAALVRVSLAPAAQEEPTSDAPSFSSDDGLLSVSPGRSFIKRMVCTIRFNMAMAAFLCVIVAVCYIAVETLLGQHEKHGSSNA
ncbi:uncharacterized protein VTP21DRAFT_10995 [Calcarisporiella thermophila]|uniref:uncharacterized protein n=1 Tax=Calcarisporiella thermophila TaxID=911321 RepID=UPI0037434296